jgi:hypothetical protein
MLLLVMETNDGQLPTVVTPSFNWRRDKHCHVRPTTRDRQLLYVVDKLNEANGTAADSALLADAASGKL